jgi:hypothetical protein
MLKTKIKQFISWQRLLALVGLAVLIVISLQHPLINAQAVSEGYSSDQTLQRGIIVRLKQDDPTKIEPVGADASEYTKGVVIASNDAAVTLATDGQKAFVATSGHFDVLVSNQNGTINPGDYIAVSAVAGIGMKAGTKELYVIGRALATFDGSKDVISNIDLKDSNGEKHSVSIGRLEVDIGIAKNPLLKATEPNVPQILRKASEAVAGKPVNAIRAYLGLAVFIITTIVAASLLYAGVRSAITSIGRNPLSRKSIIRGLFQVIVTGLIVFIAGVFGVYLILRL